MFAGLKLKLTARKPHTIVWIINTLFYNEPNRTKPETNTEHGPGQTCIHMLKKRKRKKNHPKQLLKFYILFCWSSTRWKNRRSETGPRCPENRPKVETHQKNKRNIHAFINRRRDSHNI